MRADLVWWRHMLQDPILNGVPLEFFGYLPEPDIVVITDASDIGICAIVPALYQTLTYRFLPDEQALIADFKRASNNEFDINYHEILACELAVRTWGPSWQHTHSSTRSVHVHFRVDNTSAIYWQSKMSSRNTRAQLLIRLLAVWEHRFQLRISVSPIPGVENTVADAGSRRWENRTYERLFTASTQAWTESTPPSCIADLDQDWLNISARTPSRTPSSSSTAALYPIGSAGRATGAFSGSSPAS
jgi:hypothetical protein